MDASVNRIPTSKDELALLVAVSDHTSDPDTVEFSLQELKLLARTSGALVKDEITVKREKIDPTYIIGKGKVQQIKQLIEEKKITLLIFDLVEIRPAQVRNLEDTLKCRVVGRTEIILEIFARRAKSSEAKIQVELAQLNYILPRIKGLGGVLSRLGGGIGTRGPGEKMLETDRRHIIKRISRLRKRLKDIREHRKRTRRGRGRLFTGAVVGYTNAGKSTLINQLARDDLFVEDRLFATLDSFTRRVYLGDDLTVLLTDTVGFIRNLPSNLVESFRSTLDEIEESDFIIHVADLSSKDIDTSISVVNREISHLNADEKPVIFFYNKSDIASEERKNRVHVNYPEAITGSAHTEEGIDRLKNGIRNLAVKCNFL